MKKLLELIISAFLKHNEAHPEKPFVLGVTGSVASGKTTLATYLDTKLALFLDLRKTDIIRISTDSFLKTNDQLEAENIADKKGFPESFDDQKIIKFFDDLEKGVNQKIPEYNHKLYDIDADKIIAIGTPKILILEGLNILQDPIRSHIDLSIYLDAKNEIIKQWFLNRTLFFSKTSFRQPDSYWNFITKMSNKEIIAFAEKAWDNINFVNLKEHILPTKQLADIVIKKSRSHSFIAIDTN